MYYTGICDNLIISGAQGPGCPRGGCGIYCKCDPASADTDLPAPDAPISTIYDVSTVPTNHAPDTDIISASTEIINTSGDPGRLISSVATILSASILLFASFQTRVSSATGSAAPFNPPGTLPLITISGPLPEPTSFPLRPPGASTS